MEEQKHPLYCVKEREIGEIHQRVTAMETAVDRLQSTLPAIEKETVRLNENVERLNKVIIPDLSKAVSGAVKFQQETEGRRKSSTTYKWIIGILITAIGILIGILVA